MNLRRRIINFDGKKRKEEKCVSYNYNYVVHDHASHTS